MKIFRSIARFFSKLFPSRRKKRKEVRELQRRRFRDRPLREDGFDIEDALLVAAVVSSDDNISDDEETETIETRFPNPDSEDYHRGTEVTELPSEQPVDWKNDFDVDEVVEVTPREDYSSRESVVDYESSSRSSSYSSDSSSSYDSSSSSDSGGGSDD